MEDYLHESQPLPKDCDLGSILVECGYIPRRITRMAVGLLLCAFGTAVIIGTIVLNPHGIGEAVTVGGIGFLCGILLGFTSLTARRMYAWAGTEGIALCDNGRVVFSLWKDVSAVYETLINSDTDMVMYVLSRATATNHVLTIDCTNGDRLIFRTFLKELDCLVRIAYDKTLNRLREAVSSIAHQQKQLSHVFGPISFDKSGISREDGKMLTWDQVKTISLENGMFRIYKGKWVPWSATFQGKIPNLHVLIAVIAPFHPVKVQAGTTLDRAPSGEP